MLAGAHAWLGGLQMSKESRGVLDDSDLFLPKRWRLSRDSV